jgi:hypothetical protein
VRRGPGKLLRLPFTEWCPAFICFASGQSEHSVATDHAVSSHLFNYNPSLHVSLETNNFVVVLITTRTITTITLFGSSSLNSIAGSTSPPQLWSDSVNARHASLSDTLPIGSYPLQCKSPASSRPILDRFRAGLLSVAGWFPAPGIRHGAESLDVCDPPGPLMFDSCQRHGKHSFYAFCLPLVRSELRSYRLALEVIIQR